MTYVTAKITSTFFEHAFFSPLSLKKITAEIAILYRKLTKENIRSNVRPLKQKLEENIIHECLIINDAP